MKTKHLPALPDSTSDVTKLWFDGCELPSFLCYKWSGADHLHPTGAASLALTNFVDLTFAFACKTCATSPEYATTFVAASELHTFRFNGSAVQRARESVGAKKLTYFQLEHLASDYVQLSKSGADYAASSIYLRAASTIYKKDVMEALQVIENIFKRESTRKTVAKYCENFNAPTFLSKFKKTNGNLLGDADAVILDTRKVLATLDPLRFAYGIPLTADRILLRPPAPVLTFLLGEDDTSSILVKSVGVDTAVLEVAATLWDPKDEDSIKDGTKLLELASLVFAQTS